jgi:shikimate dehydrogenase
VLNATSLGHAGGLPPIERSLFARGGAIYDMNYGPAAEPLAAWARQAGLPCHDGLGMLAGQAAESFERWTGFLPDVDPVLAVLRAPS